jgi:hypothetical protein
MGTRPSLLRISIRAAAAAALMLMTPGAGASLLPLSPGAVSSAPRVEALTGAGDRVRLSLELPAIDVETIDILGESYQAVQFERGEWTGEYGAPALPALTRYVEIPAQSGASLRIVSVEERTLSDYRLLPLQDLDGSAFALDAELYRRDEFLGGEVAALGAPAIMRDLRVVPITFRPVRYNPVRHELRVATRVEIEIAFAGTDTRNAKTGRRVPPTPDFERFYGSMVVNHARDAGRLVSQTQPTLGTWLLVTRSNNPEVLSRLQPLIDWRQRMGYTTHVVTMTQTGSTATELRNWIINAYQSWEYPPEFIVLAGDATGDFLIPTFHESVSGYGGEGDHPYSLLEGNDDIPEAFVGRLSFETLDQLATIVAKILDYETTPYQMPPSWFKSACLVGDVSSGYTCVQIQQWLKERLRDVHAFARIDTIFGSPFETRMRNSVNAGVSFFGYRGYIGMSGWDVGDIYALANVRMLPFALNLTCGTGSFVSGTSINEAWLRAGSPANLIGGIGSIATATTGTHTRYNNCYYHGVAYGFFWEELYRFGEAQARGKLEMILNYGAWEPNRVTAFCYWNTLMGDPATPLWTAVPLHLTVSYPASVPRGASDIIMQVQGSNGLPVEGAWVYLFGGGFTGESTVIGGTTDADGFVDLPFNSASVGQVLVTVTGHNLQPYQGSFSIEVEPDFVGFGQCVLDDDATPPSSGNGNGRIDAGETIAPQIYLTNFGTNPAPAVTLTLGCEDPYVGIRVAGPLDYGDIAPGQTIASPASALFDVAPGTPNGHAVWFDLTVRSGANEWRSVTSLPVAAPELAYASHALTGCGALLDPGETGQLSVTITNTSESAALGPIQARLISDSYAVDVTDAVSTYPASIAPDASEANAGDPFVISSPADCVPGRLANLRIALAFADGLRDTVAMTLPVGEADAQDPTGPDAHGYYAFDNTDVGYAEAPVYGWIDATWLGQPLALTDHGEAQDDVITIDLPFPFQYYGETYTRVSVCSNGWIAMGETYLTDYRNWMMPGAGGPPGQIAPFWDDLYLPYSGGGVYRYYDAVAHRFTIAWDNITMRTDDGYTFPESFEVVLYDPAHYPTYSGDGEIVFQYETVNDNDALQHYATVGIQNTDHSDGLTYSYFHTLPATAAPLQSGRAIKLTTRGPGAADAPGGSPAVARVFRVSPPAPNPGRETTALRFGLDRDQAVTLSIFDIDGRLVRTLVTGELRAGEHRVEWAGVDADGNRVAPGVYFYRLDAGDRTATRKVLIIR